MYIRILLIAAIWVLSISSLTKSTAKVELEVYNNYK